MMKKENNIRKILDIIILLLFSWVEAYVIVTILSFFVTINNKIAILMALTINNFIIIIFVVALILTFINYAVNLFELMLLKLILKLMLPNTENKTKIH